MKRVVLITGGSRSGKSTYAEKMALELSDNPVYLATARIWDEEFRERVRHHQKRRGPLWTNLEEEKYLSRHELSGRVVVVDCLTLWSTNFFFDLESDVEQALQAACAELRTRPWKRVAVFAHGGVLVSAQVYAGLVTPEEAFSALPPYGGLVRLAL